MTNLEQNLISESFCAYRIVYICTSFTLITCVAAGTNINSFIKNLENVSIDHCLYRGEPSNRHFLCVTCSAAMQDIDLIWGINYLIK